MKYMGKYWKRQLSSDEKEGPIEFFIEVDPNEPDPDKKAIKKAKLFVMCDFECTTTAVIIEDPQLQVGVQWVSL
jgi:hypothetical protein